MNHIPMILDKNGDKDLFYDIYSLLLNNRIVFINGEIDDVVANLVVCQLLYLDSLSKNDIYLYINSPGGSITSGFCIYDTMNYISCKVITIGMGICASMAAFLLSSGNKRLALPNCEIMIHEPLGGASGQASNIKIYNDRIQKSKNKLNKLFAQNTKQSISRIEKETRTDKFMDAKEAKEFGIIDEIIKKES